MRGFVKSGTMMTIDDFSGLGGYVDPGVAPDTINVNPNVSFTQNANVPAYTQAKTLDLATLMIHEMGHTLHGGKVTPDPLNVTRHENTYRAWTGKPLRSGYYNSHDVPYRGLIFRY